MNTNKSDGPPESWLSLRESTVSSVRLPSASGMGPAQENNNKTQHIKREQVMNRVTNLHCRSRFRKGRIRLPQHGGNCAFSAVILEHERLPRRWELSAACRDSQSASVQDARNTISLVPAWRTAPRWVLRSLARTCQGG